MPFEGAVKRFGTSSSKLQFRMSNKFKKSSQTPATVLISNEEGVLVQSVSESLS